MSGLAIPALTIRQPWAQLIVDGKKRVENRTWLTNHRGRIAVHAGRNKEHWVRKPFGYRREELAWGAVIGFATLAGCVKLEHIDFAGTPDRFPWLKDHEFVEGPYCFVLEDVVRLDEPVPARGERGFWNWDCPSDLISLARGET